MTTQKHHPAQLDELRRLLHELVDIDIDAITEDLDASDDTETCYDLPDDIARVKRAIDDGHNILHILHEYETRR